MINSYGNNFTIRHKDFTSWIAKKMLTLLQSQNSKQSTKLTSYGKKRPSKGRSFRGCKWGYYLTTSPFPFLPCHSCQA